MNQVLLPHVDVPGDIDEAWESNISINTAPHIRLINDMPCRETMEAKVRGDLEKLSTLIKLSLCLVLCNKFDPAAKEAGFERILLEEVRDACIA